MGDRRFDYTRSSLCRLAWIVSWDSIKVFVSIAVAIAGLADLVIVAGGGAFGGGGAFVRW